MQFCHGYPTGATANYSYDNAGRLTVLMDRTSRGTTIASFAYTHDNVGNRLSKEELARKTSYGYDTVYRLLSALPGSMNGRDKDRDGDTHPPRLPDPMGRLGRDLDNDGRRVGERYSYDPVGNRLAGPKHGDSYTYSAGNQLASDSRHRYVYDRDGNLVSKTVTGEDGEPVSWSYAYDYENRLVQAVKKERHSTTAVSFKYDPFGRRIEKKVENTREDDGAKVHRYLYDGQNIVLEYVGGREEGHGRKSEPVRYLQGPGVDEHLAVEENGRVYYYHADGLGSVAAITDKKDTVVESFEYNSFGNTKRHGGEVKQPYAYTGREWDKETGLYYYRARYYDPMEGRFISRDPIGFKGGDVNLYGYVDSVGKPQTNLYAYTDNNPIRYTDPYGLFGWDTVFKYLAKRVAVSLTSRT